MDYEKAYKEALQRARKCLDEKRDTCFVRPDVIFPELKESEDEQTRKEIFHFILDNTLSTDMRQHRWLAWLEKQGEKKPTDKVEPKFKIGDWITDGYLHNKITDVLEDRYIVETKYIKRSVILFEHESCYHLWTIADAKDGDVLKYKGCTFIFKKTEPSDIVTNIKNPLTVLGYCGINHIGFEKTNGWGDTANCKYHPATKEQRDVLMKAMTASGYEWDAEKKELRKIEQKPKWSEEDESFLDKFDTLCRTEQIYFSKDSVVNEILYKMRDWLKSLKQRIKE